MASFADNQPLALTPYIPKYDVNQYANLIAYKQGQYDEGVQKVQGVINSLGSLDVMRDVDKSYIQGKVNTLTSSINGIANADWGNGSLVNQVSGYASKIYSDKNIQTAIISTRGIKALQDSQKELSEKHPELYTDQNRWYDNQGVQAYLNNKEVGAQYNGGRDATQFFDYNKEINGQLDKLKPGVSVNFDASTGKYTYMVDKNTRIDPKQITALVDGIISTDGRIQKQIGIDGQYTYRNSDIPSLAAATDKYFQSVSGSYANMINQYEQQKIAHTGNEKEVAYYNALIQNANVELKSNEIKRGNYNKMFSSGASPEMIKQTLFQDQLRNKYIINYQQDSHEREIKTNEEAVNTVRFQMDQAGLNIRAGELSIAQGRLGLEGQKFQMDQVLNGINPKTGELLKPGDAGYDIWQAGLKGKKGGKNADGTAIDASGEQKIVLSGKPQEIDGAAAYQGQIDTLQATLDAEDQGLRQQFLNLQPNSPTYFTPALAAAYTTWKAQQQSNLDNGREVAVPYLNYSKNIQITALKKQALENDKANKLAEIKLSTPVTGKIKFEYPYQRNGQIYNGADWDLSNNPEFGKALVEAYADLKSLHPVGQTNADGQNFYSAGDLAKVAEKYRNTPYYQEISNILSLGYDAKRAVNPDDISRFSKARFDLRGQLAKVSEPHASSIKSQMNEFYNGRSSAIGTTGQTISSPEGVRLAKTLVANSLIEHKQKTVKGTDLEKYHSFVDATNPSTGKYEIHYIDEDGKSQVTEVPQRINESPTNDPNRDLEMIVQSSPNKRTPTTGVNVLKTDKANVRYSIGKDNQGRVQLYIINGPDVFPFYKKDAQNNDVDFQSLGEADSYIRGLANTVNPATGRVLTVQEILNLRNNPVKK